MRRALHIIAACLLLAVAVWFGYASQASNDYILTSPDGNVIANYPGDCPVCGEKMEPITVWDKQRGYYIGFWYCPHNSPVVQGGKYGK